MAQAPGTHNQTPSAPTRWRGSGIDQEVRAFTEYLNNILADDPALQSILPMPLDGGIFEAIKNGVLLCRVMLKIDPALLDEKKMILQPKNMFHSNQNHELALSAARQAGLVVVNIGPQDLSSGNPNLCLGLIFQCIRCLLLSKVNVKRHPSLLGLLDEGEGLENFMSIPSEIMIMRWVNFHLEKANHSRRVFNFDEDLKDGVNYIVLLHQLNPACGTSILQAPGASDYDRAAFFLAQAEILGSRVFLQPEDVVSGRAKLNLAFLANLLDRHLQMQSFADVEKVNEAIAMEKSLKEKMSREEHDLRQWMGKEEQRFRGWMVDEEKKMKESLEKEAQEHQARMEAERLEMERQRAAMEQQKRDLEIQQQMFQHQQSQQSMMGYPPPQHPAPQMQRSFTAPAPAPAPAQPQQKQLTPVRPPQNPLGKRWKHGNILCLASLMTDANMRINKQASIDAKGWSFKPSQWMLERTKTEVVKFRNIGNEGMYLLCYGDKLTFGSGSGPEAEFLVWKHGKGGKNRKYNLYSFQSCVSGYKIGFTKDSVPLVPQHYQSDHNKNPRQFLFTVKVHKTV